MREVKLSKLEERREWKDLTTINKMMNQLEEVDNVDLLLTKESESREMRGHRRILRRKDV